MLGRHHRMSTALLPALLWFGPARRQEIAHRELVEEVIDLLELQAVRHQPVGALAYGYAKRVELGRALCMQPAVLLLDEPMAGMNAEEKEDMARYILDVNELAGVTRGAHRARHGRGHGHLARGSPSWTSAGSSPTAPRQRSATTRRSSRPTWARDAEPGDDARASTCERRTFPRLLAGRRDAPAGGRATGEAVRHLAAADLGAVRRSGCATSPTAWPTLGVGRGDVVAVLGDNRPEWLITELAAQCLGAAVVGIYPTSIGDEIRARARAGRGPGRRGRRPGAGRQADRAEGRAAQARARSSTTTRDGLDRLSAAVPGASSPTSRRSEREAARPRPAAGSTPRSPRPIRPTPRSSAPPPARRPGPSWPSCRTRNLLAMAEHLTEIDPIEAGDRYVSFLPLAWIGEQMLAVACGLRSA